MDITALIPIYLQACTVERKTERTVESYGETLRHFCTAIRRSGLPTRVTAFGPADVYGFLSWVQQRNVSSGTVHRRQREVKAFVPLSQRGYFEPPDFFSRLLWH